MINKQNLIKPLILFLFLICIIILSTYFYLLKKEENLLDSRYINYSKTVNTFIENLIEDKKNATLIMAITLSKDKELISFINEQKSLKIDYKNISDEIKNNTKFKNTWIQIIDKEGNSIYRSWSDKKNDNLNFRKDLKETLVNQKASSSISVGFFDLTIKGRAPIYDNNELIGFIEVITHFNSISEKLENHNINSIVIADKKYKEKIIYPYSNFFIADYYISTKNLFSFENSIEFINKYNLIDFINIKNYLIKDNYLIHKYQLSNKFDSNLGYIINFTKLSDIDIETIKSFKTQLIMTILIALIVLTFIFIIYIYIIESKNINTSNLKLKKHIKQLKIQQNYKQSILDSQSSIIVITNGKTIISSNKKLLEFFTDVKNIQEFKKKYICICSAFVDLNDEKYIIEKNYNNENWAEYILNNPKNNFKVAMYNSNKELRHFSIKVSSIDINRNIIVTLTDITAEIKQIEINKEKDRLLFQQSKLTAVTDMLKNISHHWRQPLSLISTIASGMKLQKELNILDDDYFNKSCENIISNTNKLSEIIENFSSFFNNENQNSSFMVFENIENTIKFMNSTLELENIKCNLTFDKDLILNCNKTDFTQAIINILDNSIYALINKQNIDNRFIFIELKNNILCIKDTGNGIDENIISKIFEPYITTKHQSYGIGLGLYFVQDFFTKKLSYKIDVKNVTFIYRNKEYKGTNFIIDFN